MTLFEYNPKWPELAGGLVKVLELSEQPVPDELRKIASEVEQGWRKIQSRPGKKSNKWKNNEWSDNKGWGDNKEWSDSGGGKKGTSSSEDWGAVQKGFMMAVEMFGGMAGGTSGKAAKQWW